MKKVFALLMGLIFIASSLRGQQVESLTGSYDQVYFIEMVQDLESRYELQFFFEPSLDSTKISLDFNNIPIGSLLDQITSISGIKFFLKESNIAIATGEYSVTPKLSESLFTQLSDESPPTVDQSSILANIRDVTEEEIDQRLANELIEIGEASRRFNGSSATIAGHIRETKTGEPIIGASVFIKEPLIGSITDQFGYYTITLPKGRHELQVNSTGMKAAKRQILLHSDGTLDVDLRDDIIALREVVVTGESNTIDNLQTGFASLNLKNIKQIPSIMGEADIMKIALTLPGVQTVGEGAAGFNVRGGCCRSKSGAI